MKTGLAKIIFLFLILVIAFLFPIENSLSFKMAVYISIPTIVWGLMFLSIMNVSGLADLDFDYRQPCLSSKLDVRNPFTYIYFLSLVCLSFGFGSLIGDYIFSHGLNYISLLFIVFGTSSLIGVFITIKDKTNELREF